MKIKTTIGEVVEKMERKGKKAHWIALLLTTLLKNKRLPTA